MSKDSLLKQATNISQFFFFIKKNVVVVRAFSCKYISYRVLRPILKGYYKLFNIFYPNRPWASPASIIFFDKVLTQKMVGLEYGSGQSTIYFAKKLKKLISVEHDKKWYKEITKRLKENKIENVKYFFIPEQNSINYNYPPKKPQNRFHNYYSKVTEYENNYFDFAFIDGRARVKCGINAIEKIKSGGIFVLDNSERARYELLHLALKQWPKVETTTGLTNTTIWIKP